MRHTKASPSNKKGEAKQKPQQFFPTCVPREDIPVKDIKYVEAKEVIHLRDTVIPLVRLDRVLDVEPQEDPEHLTVVIVKRGDQQAGLVVDDLIGQQEIVIKSLGKYMTGNKLISGATILGDGEVALIIDANTLM